MIPVYICLVVLGVVIFALLRQLNCERTERQRLVEYHQQLAATIRFAQLSSEIEDFNPQSLHDLREAMASTLDVEGV